MSHWLQYINTEQPLRVVRDNIFICNRTTFLHWGWWAKHTVILIQVKMLFVTKPDIFCIPCKSRVCKFPKNSMDVNYVENFWWLILKLRTCTIVIHTIFRKFTSPRLTRPSSPIRYSILRTKGTVEYPWRSMYCLLVYENYLSPWNGLNHTRAANNPIIWLRNLFTVQLTMNCVS